jgi:hypothetical protein
MVYESSRHVAPFLLPIRLSLLDLHVSSTNLGGSESQQNTGTLQVL